MRPHALLHTTQAFMTVCACKRVYIGTCPLKAEAELLPSSSDAL